MAVPKRKGDGTKRMRKTTRLNDFVRKEIGTDVLVSNDEELKAFGINKRGTVCASTSVRSGKLFTILFTESQILELSFKGFRKQQKMCEQNKQDFYNDMFLQSVKIIPKGVVATKWGFSYGDSSQNKKEDGRSDYNKVVKYIYLFSGERIDYLTPKLCKKGAQHVGEAGKGKTKKIYEQVEMEEQVELVRKLPNNCLERRIMQPEQWIIDLVYDIKSIENEFEYIDKHDCTRVDRRQCKQALSKLLSYNKYINHRDKLQWIIDNYKTDYKQVMEFRK